METPIELPTSAKSLLTPAQLAEGLATSARWLERHAEAINALNVYPVPDGDTGLNMSLTLRSAADRAIVAPDTVASVAENAARGALLGARGNSGVILAQILRGMSSSLSATSVANSTSIADALARGAEAAYAAVPNPVEGTILTVALAAARAAQDAANRGAGVIGVIESAQEAAESAVAATPDLLPVLKQAGVVDAGGEGFRVMLEGLLRHLRGEPVEEGSVRDRGKADLEPFEHQDTFGYCTEVLFRSPWADHEGLRKRLHDLGSSLLVVGDDELVKIHIHTYRPGAVLELATQLGEILKVKVDNLRVQGQEFSRRASGSPRAVEPGTCAIAVAQGKGFQDLFASLGSEVVSGGQTMNPSVEAIVAAIEQAPRTDVIVFPNHRNVVLAAEEAARLANERVVAVLPTVSLPQGIAAVLALNPDADLESNLGAARDAADRCHSIEITRAVRDLTLDGLAITAGNPFALVDGRLVATSPQYDELVGAALAHLPAVSYEVATIYTGAQGTPSQAGEMGEVIERRLGLAVEVLEGGEPNYEYIISIE